MKNLIFLGIGASIGVVSHMLYVGLSLPYNERLREDLKAAIRIAEEP